MVDATEPDILVIEDNDDHADLIGRALTRAGATHERAMDGIAGLERLHQRKHQPALVLLDLKMPGMSGHEVLRTIRGEPETQGVPVVVLTTSGAVRDMEEALLAGASGYVVKPTRWKELRDIAASFVSRYIQVLRSESRIVVLCEDESRSESVAGNIRAELPTWDVRTAQDAQNPSVLGAPILFILDGPETPLTLNQMASAAWIAVRDEDADPLVKRGVDEVVPTDLTGLRGAVERANARYHVRRQLSANMREQAQFSSQMAHTLQVPARRMAQLSQVALDDLSSDGANIEQTLRMIVDEGRRLEGRVRDIMDYAKAMGSVRAESVLLTDCLDWAMASLRGEVQMAHPVLHTGLSHTVQGERVQLGQVFQNLMSNALQFRDPARKLVVEVQSTQHPDGSVTVLFRDNGIGMTPEAAQQVFQPLFRADDTTPGLGLGLSIVDEVMRRLGGAVRVASEPGVGSVLLLHFPATG